MYRHWYFDTENVQGISQPSQSLQLSATYALCCHLVVQLTLLYYLSLKKLYP